MSTFLSELGGITAGVGAEGLAFAAGFAASHALQPEAVTIAQDAWNGAQVRRLDALMAAQAAAEGLIDPQTMATEASYSGYDSTRFAYLYGVSLNAPGMGELLTMLRRKTINPGNFAHGLRKARLEPMWDTALADLAVQYIGLGDIAMAIVRSALPAPSYVPVPPPTTGLTIPRFPQVQLDPEALAAKLGFDKQMLQIMVARSGLSLAPGLAAQSRFRSLINDQDYLLAVAEGDLRTEWADTLLNVSRQILTSGEYAERELRGYTDRAGRLADTDKHGMSHADSDKLFQVLGRPLNVHQITTGLARGGTFNPQQGELTDPYNASVHESNIKPAYYDLAIANKYSYSVPFWWRAMAQANAFGPIDPHALLLFLGNEPTFATQVVKHYVGTGTVAADPHIAKAETQLWTRTHSSYVGAMTDDPTATTSLTAAGVDPASIPKVLSLWAEERSLIRKQLSPKEIRTAVNSQLINPATGVAWTAADAMAALLARGYDQADATTYLAE